MKKKFVSMILCAAMVYRYRHTINFKKIIGKVSGGAGGPGTAGSRGRIRGKQ